MFSKEMVKLGDVFVLRDSYVPDGAVYVLPDSMSGYVTLPKNSIAVVITLWAHHRSYFPGQYIEVYAYNRRCWVHVKDLHEKINLV